MCAVVMIGLIVAMASDADAWATITVNSLADPGKPGICALRDAITAANTQTATNGCAAGNGHDTINFRVTGTIRLTDTLPRITDAFLTINGPPSPGITISGAGKVPVIQVLFSTLNLNNLTISDGLNNGNCPACGAEGQSGAGIGNLGGNLTITSCTFSRNQGVVGGAFETVPTAMGSDRW
jgi:hypothetical protein